MNAAKACTIAAIFLAASPVAAKEEHGLSSADRQFLKEAAMGNLTEVHLGALAAKQGSTPAVREFGRWMISAHSFASRELSTITEKLHGEKPPLKLGAKAEETMTKLESLKGAEFDQAYLAAMKSDHEEDAKKIGAEARDGTDPLVKSFAANFEPAVKEHLAEIELLMAGTKGGNEAEAEKDANMKAAVGGMSGTPKGNTDQAKAIQEQHKKD